MTGTGTHRIERYSGNLHIGTVNLSNRHSLISTPAVKLWNLGVEFSNSNLLNSTPKFHNSTAGVEIRLCRFDKFTVLMYEMFSLFQMCREDSHPTGISYRQAGSSSKFKQGRRANMSHRQQTERSEEHTIMYGMTTRLYLSL